LTIAYTNLGNIRFRRHDPEGAEILYRKALEMDPRQPEAQYNLGYLTLERGQAEESIPLFMGALEADPKWWAFRAKTSPYVQSMRSRLLRPTSFSPLR